MSQNLRRRASTGMDSGHEGFWLRACTPRNWTHDLEDEPALSHVVHGRLHYGINDTAVLFTDGSGGKRSGDPRRRRATFGGAVIEAVFDKDAVNRDGTMEVGYALVEGLYCWLSYPTTLPQDFVTKALALAQRFVNATGRQVGIRVLWLLHGRLDGRKQTVPRAELRAIQVL